MDESLPPAAPPSALPPDARDDDAFGFTPVPSTRNRHDGWTAQRQSAFLVALAKIGLVAAAARAVGMSARSAYRLRARDTLGSFSSAREQALEDGRRRALDTGIARAIDGQLVPIHYRGRKVGEYVRYDDRLLIAALRATAALTGSTAARDAVRAIGKDD